MKNQEGESPYYRILLSIKHPNMDPTIITQELCLEPVNSWRAGQERKTPAGTRLAGVNEVSFWTTKEDAIGDRLFFSGIMKLIKRLEASSDFVKLITSTGGTISVIAQLPGRVNIGDEIAVSDLERLYDLNINLGIEVFPDFEIHN